MTSRASFDFVVGGIAREVAERLAAEGAGAGPVPFKETAVFLYVPVGGQAPRRPSGRRGRSDRPAAPRARRRRRSSTTSEIHALVLATKQRPEGDRRQGLRRLHR